MKRNAVVAALGAVAFMVYIVFVVAVLPMGLARPTITAVLLLVVGFCSAAVMTGPLNAKLLLLLIVPLIHIVYEGLDPAKPALTVIVGVVELLCLWIGAALGHLVTLKFRKSTN